MSIHLRKRGDIWHARGTIRIGRDTITIKQFSTGTGSRAEAEQIASREERRIRAEHEAGPSGRQKSLTVADAVEAYLDRPGGVASYDEGRLVDMTARIGDRSLSDAGEAWSAWLRMRGGALAPASVARFRSIYAAAIAYGCRAHHLGQPPEIPAFKHRAPDRIVYLSEDERARLLAAYSPHARRVVVMLAYQGMRTQEALRLDWRDVSMKRETIFIRESKTGLPRSVPGHPRVLDVLTDIGPRDVGPVFLSSRGEPYADTRGEGGNPLRKPHETACRKAAIMNFRVHDWRHDWAARMVMAGVDLETIRKLGGWTTLRMVQKYASVTAHHMREAIRKIG